MVLMMIWIENVFGMSWWEVLRCIGRDFNVVQYPCELLGDPRQSPTIRIHFCLGPHGHSVGRGEFYLV
jgi:hypothetical protein